MELKPLDWDSNLFHIKVGRIDFCPMDTAVDLLSLLESSDHYKLVYVICEEELPELIFSKGNLRKVDTKVDYYSPKRKVSPKARIEQLRERRGIEKEKLYEMAFIAGEYSRFSRDPHFSRAQFQSLYRIWVDKSIDGSIADQVFVAYSDSGDPAGMITTQQETNSIRIGLLAVLPKFQGSGIGKNLVHKAFERCNDTGLAGVHVATQEANKLACDFYLSMGFELSARTHIYHYWNL